MKKRDWTGKEITYRDMINDLAHAIDQTSTFSETESKFRQDFVEIHSLILDKMVLINNERRKMEEDVG